MSVVGGAVGTTAQGATVLGESDTKIQALVDQQFSHVSSIARLLAMPEGGYLEGQAKVGNIING